ncbi:efflux RND transporter periplasmic adaptor subunit [Hymenobacter ginsengisoli]|uniref:Efflux RND transporter periplasmic adaptor subunit n=1 Tax=Hymenobacter ginsengisoli TaxID=1051626 RepID=A0ABP8QL20_9BACT
MLTLAALLAAPALLLSGCGSSSGDAAEQASAKAAGAASPAAPAAYPAVQVTAAPPAQALTLPGELESFYQTDITPRVSAYVRRVNVDIGDHVRAGQVLAELDAPELTAALSEALSKQKAAEATAQGSRGSYRRLRQTSHTAGAVSPLAVDQARTLAASDSLAVVAARAHYRAAAQMAAYLRLTAPFAGTITERTAAPGALVSQGGAPLFKLKQLNPLRLRVAVPEAYVGEIQNGNPVQFTVRAFPGRTFTGKLTRTAGSVQAATRSEQVELDIPNPKEELKPGMFASASLPVQARANSLFVPKTAVVNTAERTYLIRVANGRTELVDVQLGDENAGQVQVFGKLRAGDVVLKSGSEELAAGQPVQVAMR